MKLWDSEMEAVSEDSVKKEEGKRSLEGGREVFILPKANARRRI
jgi:hypothetical protein